jgi:Flp pilus assembly protein TadD
LLLEEELRQGTRPPATLHAHIGATWVLAGDLARAAAALEQALALEPDHPAALRNLAHVYARVGRLIEAAALIQRAARNPGPAPASK